MSTLLPLQFLTRSIPSTIGSLCLILFLLPITGFAQDNTFTVTVAAKTAQHPWFNQGWPEAFVVDGVQGREITLERGTTYTFQLSNVDQMHPFYISTSEVGVGQGVYSEGVTGNFSSGNATVTFTPGAGTPDLLYYQCSSHDRMGGRINVTGEVAAGEEVALLTIAEGLTAPVTLSEPPDGSGRLFVVDQAGLIRIIGDAGLLPEPFLDVRDRIVEFRENFDERGLLGLAFHPQYAQNGRFFVHYSAPLREGGPEEWDHTSHISEFRVIDGEPDRADPGSERVIIRIDQPQFNHNGGTVAFGPDGYLFISLGDGGGGGDRGEGHVQDWYEVNEGGNAQAYRENLLGTILRLDVDGEDPYVVPPDNPFVGTEGLDEIFAFGLRNPYRISFDQAGDRELYAADAGQNRWEEVNIITSGGNYGWNVKEGTHCFNTDDFNVDRPDCPDVDPEGRPLLDPVIEYPNIRLPDGLGTVVVGGYVYRGTAIPQFEGRYIFGDWSQSFGEPTGQMFIVTERAEEGLWPFTKMFVAGTADGELGSYLLGFGQDQQGEVYALTTQNQAPVGSTGRVSRLVHPTAVSSRPEPAVPGRTMLEQNYPNPFNPSTTIRFQTSEPGHVSLRIYDLLGREVAVLVDQPLAPGQHTVMWHGTDEGGRPAASGVYIYRIRKGDMEESRLMTLLK